MLRLYLSLSEEQKPMLRLHRPLVPLLSKTLAGFLTSGAQKRWIGTSFQQNDSNATLILELIRMGILSPNIPQE